MAEKEIILQKYIDVFEDLTIPIVTFDTQGRVIDVNAAFCENFGFHRQEVVGKMPPHPYWPPEEVDAILRKFNEIVVQGRVDKTSEVIFMKRDGSRVPALNYRAALKDKDGVAIGYAGFITDLTKRRQAEDALRKSEKRYKSLYECIPDGYVRVDMSGRIIEANKVYCGILGYSEEEIKLLTYQQLTPAKWHKMEQDLVEKMIKPQGCSNAYEKEYIRKDGVIFPVSLNTWLEKDEAGKFVAMGAIVRDMTEIKKVDEAVRYYKIFMENAGDAIFLARTHDARIFEANAAAIELFGYSREEFLSMIVGDLRAEDFRASLDDQLNEIRSKAGVLRFEIRSRTKSGREFSAAVSWKLVDIDGQKTLVAIVRDISAYKNLETSLKAKLEENEKMNKFMSGRELRIIELKKQVDDLLERLGEKKKYNV